MVPNGMGRRTYIYAMGRIQSLNIGVNLLKHIVKKGC